MFISFACRRTGENVKENSAKPFPTVPVLVVVRFTKEASVLKKKQFRGLPTAVSLLFIRSSAFYMSVELEFAPHL